MKRLLPAAVLLWLGLLAPAVAQSAPPACTGQNLLEKAEQDDPAGYAAFLKQAAAYPNAEGLLWRVERDGVPASHLFGTMHLTDPRIVDFPVEITETIEKSRVVALELAAIGDAAATARDMAAVIPRAMNTKGDGISSLPAEDRSLVAQALAERGVPAGAAGQFQPWFLALTMAMTPCEVVRQQANLDIVDARVANIARARGIPVTGLETMAEQIDVVASVDADVIRKVLIHGARAGDAANDAMETMVQLYLDRKVGHIISAYRQISSTEEEFTSGIAFLEALLGPRNIVMRDRALPLLAEGNAFIAVGALHLSGADGLVEMFRQEGYTVTRVW